jgi:hypothetical protein
MISAVTAVSLASAFAGGALVKLGLGHSCQDVESNGGID